MANGSSGAGLIILTGLSIAAVVGLYAADAIPRRSGPTNDLSWPRWQSQPANDPGYNAAPPPQAAQGQGAPAAQDGPPTSDRDQSYPEQQGYPPAQQQPYPNQQQGNPQQQQPPDGNYPQDVPTEGGPPTQQQYQQPNGQPQPY